MFTSHENFDIAKERIIEVSIISSHLDEERTMVVPTVAMNSSIRRTEEEKEF
jgi:hypothetical protein